MVYPGSELQFLIHLGSRICIEEFKSFNPKKLFLMTRKYDPGCSDPDFFYLSRIQGSRRPRIRIRNTVLKDREQIESTGTIHSTALLLSAPGFRAFIFKYSSL
jgi:hypothetical protein